MTANTIVDPDELAKELKLIKEKGFAYSDSEVHSWTMAIGAPVFNREKMVMAGLGMAIPKERGGRENLQELIEMVKETALKISNELGYRKNE